MRRTMIVAAAGLTCALAFVAGLAPVGGQDRGEKKGPSRKDVKEMMAKAHKGDKAPLANLGKELKAENQDWAQVARDVKVLTDMADMLRTATGGAISPYTSPDGYIASATALDKAARAKDGKAAVAALAGLHRSCAGCHGYTIP